MDAHIGKRLRTRRNVLGLSQNDVGKSIGVTFQQVQKYERGVSQVAPSKLWDLRKILDVDITYFFDGLDKNSRSKAGFAEDKATFETENKLANKETLALVRAYYDIEDPSTRKDFIKFMKKCGKKSK